MEEQDKSKKENRKDLLLSQAYSLAALETSSFERSLLQASLPQKELSHQVTCQPAGRVDKVLFLPDGQRLAAAIGRSVYFWDISRRKIIRIINAHTRSVHDIAFTPDGKKK